MFTHGRPPAAPFETGPIPLWSECFLVVSCPDLHVIEPESQWTGLISSGIDVRWNISSIAQLLRSWTAEVPKRSYFVNANPNVTTSPTSYASVQTI